MYLPKVIAFNAKDETAKKRYGEIADFMGLEMCIRDRSEDDVDDIETFASGISAATISYTTKSSVDGGCLLYTSRCV